MRSLTRAEKWVLGALFHTKRDLEFNQLKMGLDGVKTMDLMKTLVPLSIDGLVEIKESRTAEYIVLTDSGRKAYEKSRE